MGFVEYDEEDRLEAACTLQAWFRALRARVQVRTLAKTVFERVYDEGSAAWYYRNTTNGSTSWEPPLLLPGADNVLTPRARRRFAAQEAKRKRGALKRASDMTESEAARFIQNLFRTRAARNRLKMLIATVYQKAFDEDGNVFYYNTRTGESSWDKPAFLGAEDLDDILDVEEAAARQRQADDDHYGKYKSMEECARLRAEEGLAEVQRFLEVHKLEVVYDRLVEEGFDDMDALAAMQPSDVDALGVREKFREPLYSAVVEYRIANNLTGPLYGRLGGDDGDDDDDDNDDDDGAGPGAYSDEDGGSALDGELPENDFGGDEGKRNVEGKRGFDDFDDEDDVSESEASRDDSYLDSDSVTCEDDLEGMEMERVFPGDGVHFARKGQFAMVHYVASLENGSVFESSRKRGRPFDFLVGAGHVIPAWDKAVRLMSRGERINLRVEPRMAYGPVGRPPVVPPDATLRFEIELIDTYYAPVGQLIDDEELEDDVEDNVVVEGDNDNEDGGDDVDDDNHDDEDGDDADDEGKRR
ncbi:Peptidyl-prolyl cis-trans isomerase [Hondaea fermentalgiana]|uniref:peptidylprolyl isomerase n=1 Tax=Hondaea fermentalgiana TaxID=2315210 RepID=A0A2R5GUZ1_9STRA|nr:Peptidyl-prolyl cis-trans isomerase [Hondaea fermentalgiana]|eukprot:GBG34667.1 Peptidyl-prolyl cis-trans isomerase [Hondaea fermentalgiana]